MTYSILFVIVAQDRKSSVLSELGCLRNHVIVNCLQYNHSLGVASTDLIHTKLQQLTSQLKLLMIIHYTNRPVIETHKSTLPEIITQLYDGKVLWYVTGSTSVVLILTQF